MNQSKILAIGVVLALFAGCKKKEEEQREPPQAAAKEVADGTKVEPGQPAPAERIHAEEIDYQSDGVTLKGYLAYDSGVEGKRPGVLVVHEWWGHNEYARGRARMLAEMGYTALAVDMYGDGKQAAHPDDAQKFSKEVMSNLDVAAKRFEAAKTLLESQATSDPQKIAAIGYCMGGGIVLQMARRGMDLDGVASFHGMLGTEAPVQKGTIKAKLLVLHGAADPFVKPEQVDAFKKEMQDAEVDMRFHAYEGAKHAFTNPDATELGKKFSIPIEYDEKADQASWAELEAFLKEVFESP